MGRLVSRLTAFVFAFFFLFLRVFLPVVADVWLRCHWYGGVSAGGGPYIHIYITTTVISE